MEEEGEDGGGVHCIPVDNNLDESGMIRVEKDGKMKHYRPDVSKFSAETYLNQQQRDCLISGVVLGAISEEAEAS